MATPEELDFEFTTTRDSLKPLPFPHLTGMKLAGDIILGDFKFNTIDEYGVLWVITDIQGWWAPPEPEVVDIPRGYGDGSYDVKGRYKARALVLNGSILVRDPALVEAARDRLVAAIDLVYKGTWLRTGTNPIRASWVRMSGPVTIDTVKARGRTDFSIGLRAPDPIKYMWNDTDPDGYFTAETLASNTSEPSSGSVTITNQGNYPVPIFLELTGPLVGPATITNTANEELIIVTEGLAGPKSAFIVNKQLEFSDTELKDIATLTCTAKHSFAVGNNLNISGLGAPFDGDWVIKSVPTDTTFTYEVDPPSATIAYVAFKSLSSSVATLETLDPHGISVGQQVTVYGVDDVFNGTYTTLSGTTGNVIKYAKTRVPPQSVVGTILSGNLATLTTNAPHFFTVGDRVTVTNIDQNYNGTYTITAVPSSTQFSYAATRTNARDVVNIGMTSSVITATTSTSHGFRVGEAVRIEGVGPAFNGTHTITAVTNNTFNFIEARTSIKTVVSKSRFSNVAALTTSDAHGLDTGESVQITDVDGTFNGTFTVTGVPSSTTFTYANSGANINPTTVVGGKSEPLSRKIGAVSLSGNVASVVTKAPHGALVGETVTVTNVPKTVTAILSRKQMIDGKAILTSLQPHNLTTGTRVTIANVGTEFNGTHTVTVTSTTVFEYQTTSTAVDVPITALFEADNATATYTTVGGSPFNGTFTIISTPNENTISYGCTGTNTAQYTLPEDANAFVALSQNIASTLVSGKAVVGGGLPFTSASGTASVSDTYPRTVTGGTAVKKNNVVFTPGQNGQAFKEADILEIDTQDREVAYNGETIGARGKIDVLADFIRLMPGDNTIEFSDAGSPEGQATLKVFYRSGWLA